MKLNLNKIIFKSCILLLTVLHSCVYHSKKKIAIIKNDTPNNLLISISPSDDLEDSTIVKPFNNIVLKEKGYTDIFIPDVIDSSAYIFILNYDVINEAVKSNDVKDIKKRSLIKTYRIKLNEVDVPLDTLYIK